MYLPSEFTKSKKNIVNWSRLRLFQVQFEERVVKVEEVRVIVSEDKEESDEEERRKRFSAAKEEESWKRKDFNAVRQDRNR